MTKAKTLRIREDPCLGFMSLLPGVATMPWTRDFCGVGCDCGLVLLFDGDFGVTKAKTLRIREDPFLGTVFLVLGVATMAWIHDYCGVVFDYGLVL